MSRTCPVTGSRVLYLDCLDCDKRCKKEETKMSKKITNIEWDTDGETVDDLPTETDIPADTDDEHIADYLSDRYGWCVKSFVIEEA